ncbi:MAG: NeuD/PglB/VioB family sugar acetyltransferase [Planctomycetes bacterium]|nr:NeuD/PglB/VioB family sugar acetyltransferase [Planctomycetota bacterium]
MSARPSTRQSLLLIGCGSHARVVLDLARAQGPLWKVVVAIDAMKKPDAAELEGVPIRGGPDDLEPLLSGVHGALLGIGDNALRERLGARVLAAKRALVSCFHPKSSISPRSRIGPGVAACPGAVVMTGAVVGEGAILNTGCTVDHDCEIGAYAHIAPGAHLGGRVKVGARTLIGIGASVRQNIRIGADAVVGAGAAVVADVPDGVTVVGVPACPSFRR